MRKIMKRELLLIDDLRIKPLHDFIVNGFLDILNKLECGKEVDYTKVLDAVSLKNALETFHSMHGSCSFINLLPNLPYYLSYYK